MRDYRWVGAPVLTFVLAALMVGAVAHLIKLLVPQPGAQADTYRHLRLQVELLAITGAFGGLIYGLIADKGALRWTWFDPQQSFVFITGALADALIGVGGAWGVFLVLGRTLRLEETPDDMLVLIGLGVVAGFGARTLLVALSRNLERMAEVREQARAEARQEVKLATSRQLPYTAGVTAQTVAGMFDATEPAMRPRLKGTLEGSIEQIEAALQVAPRQVELYWHLGALKKRLALIVPETKRALLLEAIEACTRALDIDKRLAWAYYNRACYRALDERPVAQVADDLKSAVAIDGGFKNTASNDEDLAAYVHQPEIASILA